MADKTVERVEPPFAAHWDIPHGKDVAYMMVYTHVDDTVESVAFDRKGGEIARQDGDFRRTRHRVQAAAPATGQPAAQPVPPKPAEPPPPKPLPPATAKP
jgi:hypothetical protein